MVVEKGKVWKMGHDIDTDQIYPGRYLGITDPSEIGQYAMKGLIVDFHYQIQNEEVIIVAGRNFGCGSSREHAAIALKEAGVKAVIAESFGRIFFRNSINLGLPAVECPEILDLVDDGDELEIRLKNGKIDNITKKKTYEVNILPDAVAEIMFGGGLIEYYRKKIELKEM
ncbi:MAG: 3-isopropylmalate dehydratase small subunit [Bacillota bacterium]|nr:3-isopropylmalate dehydratase small subunit [Bacillota bacterium]MDW7670165.1 3-isopropylmalate dehydratase small subunit [Bacillota bacterium]